MRFSRNDLARLTGSYATTQSRCAKLALIWGILHFPGPAVSSQPRRVENLHTDKGKVPVYATGVVEQPWDDYSADDHATWATLYARQREILPGRACSEFLDAQDAMGMTADRIPKFSDLNVELRKATGWQLIGVEGLLPELDFFDHLA